MERETGIEPATTGLGSRCSTIELLPLCWQSISQSPLSPPQSVPTKGCPIARTGIVDPEPLLTVNRTSPFIQECHTLANCSLKLTTALDGRCRSAWHTSGTTIKDFQESSPRLPKRRILGDNPPLRSCSPPRTRSICRAIWLDPKQFAFGLFPAGWRHDMLAWIVRPRGHRDDEDESYSVLPLACWLSGQCSESRWVLARERELIARAGKCLEPGPVASRFEGAGRVGGRFLHQYGQ